MIVQVTAKMAEPIITYGEGMHLDGILAWGHYRAMSEDKRQALPSIAEEWAIDMPLPLVKWHREVKHCGHAGLDDGDGVWGWAATAAIMPEAKHGVHEIRKKIATDEMIRWTTAKSVHPGSGPAKAYNIELPTVFAPVIRWFADGDAAEIERLLSHVYGIGKRCTLGLGRVLDWEVTPVNIDLGFILSHRVMACEEKEATAVVGIRPPYHHLSRRTWAVGP